MKTISERLKYARVMRGYATASDFARAIGIDEQTYINQENGSRGIKIAAMKKYRKALNINLEWLQEGTGPMEGAPFPEGKTELAEVYSNTIWVPVISWVAAGKFAEPKDVSSGFAEEEALQFLPVLYHRRTVFALQVKGTSMNRIAPEDSYIFVDYEDRELIDRRLFVFLVDNSGTFKRYRQSGGKFWLEPDSTEPHDIIIPGDGLRVIGRVVNVQMKV